MKTKILCILQLPPPVGGVTVLNESIVKSTIVREKYELDVIPLRFTKSFTNIGKFNFDKLFVFTGIIFKTLFKLITTKYDAVYFSINLTGIAFYRDLVLVCLFKLFRVKPIYHLHGKGQSQTYANSKSKLSLYKFVFKSSYVIMISPLLYPEVSAFIDKKQVYYVANAILPTITDNELAQADKERKTHTIPNILFLGHLWKLKGVYILLEALALLNNEGVKFNAKFVGTELDISPGDFAAKCKELNLSNNVEYLGPRYGQEKTNIYLQNDMFAFPTVNDAFGIVNLEAMEAGLPVISTIEGAIPEIIDDGVTGYLVPKYDILALSGKIKELINNPELRIQMGLSGRKKFLNTYTIDKFETNLVKIFDEICTNRNK